MGIHLTNTEKKQEKITPIVCDCGKNDHRIWRFFHTWYIKCNYCGLAQSGNSRNEAVFSWNQLVRERQINVKRAEIRKENNGV